LQTTGRNNIVKATEITEHNEEEKNCFKKSKISAFLCPLWQNFPFLIPVNPALANGYGL